VSPFKQPQILIFPNAPEFKAHGRHWKDLLHLDSLMKFNCVDQFAYEMVACGRLPPGCQSRPPPLGAFSYLSRNGVIHVLRETLLHLREELADALSGTYRLEVIALKATAYSVSVFARSKEVLDGNSLQSHFSKTDFNNLAIRKRSREIVLLHYSRDPQENVTAQLQQGHESLSRLSSSE
jgi:hypothetical protein